MNESFGLRDTDNDHHDNDDIVNTAHIQTNLYLLIMIKFMFHMKYENE